MQTLKRFGLGLVWALLFPFIVLGISIVGIFGSFNFLVEFVVMVINFFRGKKLFPVYPEDQRANEILQRAIARQNGETEQPLGNSVPPQQIIVQQNFYGAVPPQGQPVLPPGYQQGQLPPYQQPTALPPNPPQQQSIPQRPELAQLPSFDASTETIDIGGDDHE